MSGWADYGFPDKILLSSSLPILTGLTRALNERLTVCGLPTMNDPLPLWPYSGIAIYAGGVWRNNATYWGTQFDAYLNSCIYNFLDISQWDDYTGYGADFAEQSDIGMGSKTPLVRWTSDSLYAYLGEPEIKYKDAILSPALAVSWLRQKYQVLNLLYVYVPSWDPDKCLYRNCTSVGGRVAGEGWCISNCRQREYSSYDIGYPSVMQLNSNLPCYCTLYNYFVFSAEAPRPVFGLVPGLNKLIDRILVTADNLTTISGQYCYIHNVPPWNSVLPADGFVSSDTGYCGGHLLYYDYSAPNGFKFRGEDWDEE